MKGASESGGIAPRIQAPSSALATEMQKNKVKYLLATRPSPEKLARRGITKTTNTAASLQSTSAQLQKNMTADRIQFLLHTRPAKDDLLDANIIKKDALAVAPAIQSKSLALEKELARSNLYHGLQNRPSVDALSKRGIFSSPDQPDQREDSKQQQQQQQQPRDEGDECSAEQDSSEYSQSDSASSRFGGASPYTRRSKMFHLTRLLFRSVLTLSEQNILSLEQKSVLKDLIIDQHPTILAIAETFDCEAHTEDFKGSLLAFANHTLAQSN
jgi:hypothetical protein